MGFIAPITHFLPLASLRRARLLNTSGHVLVKSGQKVNANDVIAETDLTEKHILLDIRQALGSGGGKKSRSLIERKAGEKLAAGDIIAETGSLFRRVVRAPQDCEIAAILGSQVLLATKGGVNSLRAGLSGTVVEVIPDRGAILETSGALVQGVWGNGRTGQGILHSTRFELDESLTPEKLNPEMRSAVVCAGTCTQAEALENAEALGLGGLILGSLPSALRSLAAHLKMPVILLEGFGTTPMNEAAGRILATNEKRDICLNAAPWNTFNGDRPEAIIPLPADGQVPPETDEFRPGQLVRVLSAPYHGQIGTITDKPPQMATLPNGIRALCIEVEFSRINAALIPLANLDVLE